MGWSQFRNLLMETGGVEYHKYAGVVSTLAELRSAFDDKINNDVLHSFSSLAERELERVKVTDLSLNLLLKFFLKVNE